MHTECCVLNSKKLLSLEDKALGRSSCSHCGVLIGDDTAVPIMARQASSKKTDIASVSQGTALIWTTHELLMNYSITSLHYSAAKILKLYTRHLGLTPVYNSYIPIRRALSDLKPAGKAQGPD